MSQEHLEDGESLNQEQSTWLTVGELIEALRAMPADAEVALEGCDCYGEAGGTVVLPDDGDVGGHWVGTVLIFRHDGDWAANHTPRVPR